MKTFYFYEKKYERFEQVLIYSEVFYRYFIFYIKTNSEPIRCLYFHSELNYQHVNKTSFYLFQRVPYLIQQI